MLPTEGGKHTFEKCESKSELEHQKYEKYGLQFACLMQSGINGHEIYKNVSMRHAVVLADRAPEAKNAQVTGQTQNSNGLKKRKNCDRNGQKSEKGKYSEKKCSFCGRLGSKKVQNLIESA